MPVKRKVQAGGAGGALGVVITWVLAGPLGLDVPAEVGAAISTLCGFALGWLVPSAEGE